MFQSRPQLEDSHLLCSQHVPQNASGHVQMLRVLENKVSVTLPPFMQTWLHERWRVELPVQALPPCAASCAFLRLLLCVPEGPQV